MNNNALTQPARSREQVALEIAVAELVALYEAAIDPYNNDMIRSFRRDIWRALDRIKTLREAGE